MIEEPEKLREFEKLTRALKNMTETEKMGTPEKMTEAVKMGEPEKLTEPAKLAGAATIDQSHVYCEVIHVPTSPRLPPRSTRSNSAVISQISLNHSRNSLVSTENHDTLQQTVSRKELALAVAVVFLAILSSVFIVMYFTNCQACESTNWSHYKSENSTEGKKCKCPVETINRGTTRPKCSGTGTEYSMWFHRKNIFDYAVTYGAPSMTELTVCLWLKTNQTSGETHYISYAVPALPTWQMNEFVLSLSEVKRNLQITVKHLDSKQSGVSVGDGQWHPICCTWSSQNGELKIYKDGERMYWEDNLQPGKVLTGGGIWVLGQDQDEREGGFEADQTMQGEVTQVNIFNRVLSEKEIQEFSTCCHSANRKGVVKSWNNFKSGVRGRVKIIPTNPEWCKL